MTIFYFPQFEHEPLYAYWDRLESCIVQCGYYVDIWEMCHMIYDGVNCETRLLIEQMCEGMFEYMSYEDKWETLKYLAQGSFENEKNAQSNLMTLMEQFVSSQTHIMTTQSQMIEELQSSLSQQTSILNSSNSTIQAQIDVVHENLRMVEELEESKGNLFPFCDDDSNAFVESCEFEHDANDALLDDVIVHVDPSPLNLDVGNSFDSSLNDDDMFDNALHRDASSPQHVNDIVIIDDVDLESVMFEFDCGPKKSLLDPLAFEGVENFGLCDLECMSFDVDYELVEREFARRNELLELRACENEQGEEGVEGNEIFDDSLDNEVVQFFDDSLEIKWDDVDDFLEKPILENFLDDICEATPLIRVKSLISINSPHLDFSPSYDVMTEECWNSSLEELMLIIDLSLSNALMESVESEVSKRCVLDDFEGFDPSLVTFVPNHEYLNCFEAFEIHSPSLEPFASLLTFSFRCYLSYTPSWIPYEHPCEDWSILFDMLIRALTGILDN
ncbi:hypothetical protein RND81_05G072500 [Saponaria officinalis]|uniref:Uncharacterized protein n=1 Tax=Saponaria officinalis TaxID=3572 RepID=A0AAW1KU54_SAPOF